MKNHRSTKSGRPKPVAGRSMVQWESAWCHHKVPQLLQFVHHTAGPFALTLFSADLKTVFVVWRTCLQHRVNQRQQFASQSNRCTFSALPLFYPPVPTGEVQASFSGDDPSDFAEHAFQVRISLIDMGALAFSGTLVVTGTQTGPGAYMLGIRKGTHIGTNLRDNGRCRSYINARYGAQEAQCLFVLCDLFRNSVLHSMAGAVQALPSAQISCEESRAGAPRANRSRQSVFRRYVSGSAFSGTGPELPAKYFRIP